MNPQVLAHRLGQAIREKRLQRRLTQAELASLAGLSRQKVIAVEQGTHTVALLAYAKALGALDCELKVIPSAMPTLDEVEELFE